MKTTRNALLAGVIGLAIAGGGLAPADAGAREQTQAQQRHDTGKRDDHKRHAPRKAQETSRGGERRAHASAHRAERGRQDGAFARSRPAPVSQAMPRRPQAVQDRARAAALRDARARQAVVRQQHAAFEQREAARRAQVHRRDRDVRHVAVRPVAVHPVERHQARMRPSVVEQQRLIALQRQRAASYDRYLAARQAAERQRIAALREQRRMQQYRYQQWYWQQQQALRQRWMARTYDAARDPFYYTPASYRYVRDGRAYQVNRYAADLLRQAVRYGYEMGARAGNADRQDGWRGDWRDNFAYRDASYGYNGYYVDQDEYNYYFRQGFQRGYQDAYGNDYRYGTYYGDRNDGSIATILASVLQAILGLQSY